MSNRFALVLFALCATLAIGAVACGGGSGTPSNATATGTPFYTGTEVFSTAAPGSDVPTPENLPVPTVISQPTVTASGLQIYDLVAGTGAGAQPGSIVYVNYTYWLKGGNEVDRNRLAAVRYRLTKGQTLDGLIEGLTGMAIGGKRRLIIPPALAYGSSGSGNVIPPNATLIYDIERVAPPGEATETALPAGRTPTVIVPTPEGTTPTSSVSAPIEKTPSAAPSPAPTTVPLPPTGQGPQSGSSDWHLLAALAALGATLLAFGAALHKRRTD